MAVIDIMTYNGELEALKLHLNILNDYVDTFIIVEANQTFSGQPKPLYFFQQQRYVRQFWKKIRYYIVNNWEDDELWALARNSPNTKGAHHWQQEFYVKEHIQKALKANGIQDTDLCFIGDVDEIINPIASLESQTPLKARMRVYNYYLNNESNELFWGTLIAEYGEIKNQCLNHMRSDTTLYSQGAPIGWHFTSMGGLKEVQRKLNNSYTAESYNTAEIQSLLPERYKQCKDYLGRDFQFKLNEENWPLYLKGHRKAFEHMLYERQD